MHMYPSQYSHVTVPRDHPIYDQLGTQPTQQVTPGPDDPFGQFHADLVNTPTTQVGLTPNSAGVVVGELLTLPHSHIFGLTANGPHLYIRPCYQQLLATITTLLNTSDGVLVTGTPGVGKSFFGAFLMRHYYKEGATVVYEHAGGGRRWLIPPAGGGPIREGHVSHRAFDDQLDETTTYYIYDAYSLRSPPPIICNARTIFLCAPNPRRYRSWKKEHLKPTVYMPVWSSDEVTAVVPTVYRKRLNTDTGASIYSSRFKLHGGIARLIFTRAGDKRLESDLQCDLAKLSYGADKDGTGDAEGIESLECNILQYVVATNPNDGTMNYQNAHLDFASDEIGERLVAMRDVPGVGGNGVITFVSNSAFMNIDVIRYNLFERWARRKLAAGGKFKYRWENDETREDRFIQFTPSVQKMMVGDLTNLATGEYAQLSKAHYPTLDGAITCVTSDGHGRNYHLFQMSLRTVQPINITSLNKVMMEFGVLGAGAGDGGQQHCFLHIVVPPYLYHDYRYRSTSYTLVDPLPAHVTLVVLEMSGITYTDDQMQE